MGTRLGLGDLHRALSFQDETHPDIGINELWLAIQKNSVHFYTSPQTQNNGFMIKQ